MSATLNYLYRLEAPLSVVVPYPLPAFENKWGKIEPINATSSRITIAAGYADDGCSPAIKFRLFGRLYALGTWDGFTVPVEEADKIKGFECIGGHPRTWAAFHVHDFLYQFMEEIAKVWKCDPLVVKRYADRSFRYILRACRFAMADLYYWAVDNFGGAYHREQGER